jgi:hypothetical protein
VLSIDYGPTLAGEPPALSLGRPVTLDELQMTGLKDGSAKDEKGRQFNCPNCGATVEVALAHQQKHHLQVLQQPDRPERGHRR